jgi:transposase-like protein
MTSIDLCKSELGIAKTAVIKWNSLLRVVYGNTLIANPAVIGGPNTTVEIDESVFTRGKNNVGRVSLQQWVFGNICRETGECFMIPVPARSEVTLMLLILANFRLGSIIMSDQWRTYSAIQNVPGLTHETVNHSVHFVDPDTGANTQRIERLWKAAKKCNKRQNGTHRHTLNSYMCDFVWRHWNKPHHSDPFDSFLHDIAELWSPL